MSCDPSWGSGGDRPVLSSMVIKVVLLPVVLKEDVTLFFLG